MKAIVEGWRHECIPTSGTDPFMKRVDREGFVVLPPVAMTPDESELIGNAVFVNPRPTADALHEV